MTFYRKTSLFILLSSFLFSCSHKQPSNCLVKRATFDIGSGSTKMNIYRFNSCSNKIISKYSTERCSYSQKVSYKESIVNDLIIPKDLINKGTLVLKQMKKDAIKCGATQFQAVATSAFRQASNGKHAVKELERAGIKIKLISQEEEAKLGFNGAVSMVPGLDIDNLCAWDIGGSSMQITCTHNGKAQVYLGDLASVPFKEHILKLQSSKKNSPNPISASIYKSSLKKVYEEAKLVLRKIDKDKLQNKPFIGIGGVHYYAVSRAINKSTYSVSDLNKAILERLNKNNRELGGGKYANTALSNIILVKAMMESLGITSVRATKTDLTQGLVLSKHYW